MRYGRRICICVWLWAPLGLGSVTERPIRENAMRSKARCTIIAKGKQPQRPHSHPTADTRRAAAIHEGLRLCMRAHNKDLSAYNS